MVFRALELKEEQVWLFFKFIILLKLIKTQYKAAHMFYHLNPCFQDRENKEKGYMCLSFAANSHIFLYLCVHLLFLRDVRHTWR